MPKCLDFEYTHRWGYYEMSANKRFTLGVCENGLGLYDNVTKEQYLENEDIHLILLCEVLNTLNEENEELKYENNMLRTTIGRNEAYIDRLKNKGEWR